MMSKSNHTVLQGEIWLANLNPLIGREQSGLRPVVIVSGNMLNKHMPLVFAVPLTTKVNNYKGNPVLVPDEGNGLTKESEILVFQIRTISQHRLEKRIGKVNQHEVDQIIHTLNDLLTY